ncbi:hypothetical protein AYI68_g6480 [Smittium mucronatum]|uniref:Uncharacterized protein n=1 Tax=Smittium mucronatum TaxID=133383 RepID=A0A1R0GRD0_9FUNG|nr:hypothetical protein AYI68_g6480 [Smittium mucronatum]
MGKKDKGSDSLVNRELYERMNFLYQASILLAQTPAAPTHTQPPNSTPTNSKPEIPNTSCGLEPVANSIPQSSDRFAKRARRPYCRTSRAKQE